MRLFRSLTAQNPIRMLLLGLIHMYQRLISPALPQSCKYYPSCSHYAVDALTKYGVVRGSILAGWRLLRCNPFSHGGYDPVERQTLFGEGRRARRQAGRSGSGSLTLSRMARPRRMVFLLAAMLVLLMVFATSCSFFGTTTTTGATATTGADTTGTTVAGATTTTVKAGSSAGFLAGPLKPLQALLYWVLEHVHNVGISWSWSIVLLTVIVRIVLVPLTWRQIKSMRAMQALQPQIKELQDKYKNDREVLNQKTMEFYRENKVSPFGSCLPLILQLPVFFGLYYMLKTAGTAGLDPAEAGRWAGAFALGSPDFPVSWLWINDITTFDYGLMFLYIASQFVASWQTARNSAGQQKTIAYLMPIMVGVFMFIGKWPSGLFIYWFTSNVWTIAQQFVAERIMPTPAPALMPKAAAGAAKAPAGRASGGKAPGKTPPPKAGGAKTGAAKTGPAKVTPSKATTVKPGQTGGKTGGQKTGQPGKTAGGKGQRPQRGNGGPKGTR